MTAAIENLVDELERSYVEAQERMNDPSLYSTATPRPRPGGG